MKLFSTFISIVLIFAGCSATKSTASSENTSNPSLSDSSIIISFEQTACYGTCPVHKMVILNNGKATYFGDRHVTNLGYFSANLTPQQIQDIYSKAKQLEFFKLASVYTAAMTDFPTSKLTIITPTQNHSVIAYGEYPENLSQFIRYLYTTSQNIDWKKVK